jgi:predicted GNAT family acetyltransferase
VTFGPPSERRRIEEFLAKLDAPAFDERRAWIGGTAFLTPTLPTVWDANFFRLERDDCDADEVATDAAALAAAAGLTHAAIVVGDDAVAARLAPRLGELGFEATRLVIMTLRRVPDPPLEAIEEVSGDEVAASRRQITLESHPGDEELAAQLRELDRRLAAMPGRWFAVREGGEILARAWLRSDGRTAQVEDVATSPSARGRGLARAVVSAAARVAVDEGHDLTFLIADADETTPAMYRKLGFEPLALTYRFLKTL